MLVRRLVVPLIVCWWSLVLPLFAAPQEDVARNLLRLAHEGAFSAAAPLWTQDAQGRELFERQLRSTLRVRCMRVDRIAIAHSEKGIVEADVFVTKSDRRTPDEWLPVERRRLRLQLVNDSGGWRAAKIEFPDEELADQLIAATGAERQCLLAEHSDRLSKDVIRTVFNRASTIINSVSPKNAASHAQLLRDLAAETGDRSALVLALSAESSILRVTRNRPAALEVARECLAVAQQDRDPDSLSRAWFTLGRVLQNVNTHAADTRAAFERAAELAESAEDPAHMARAHQSLGLLAYMSGDLFEGRTHLDRSLPFAQEAGDPVLLYWYQLLVAEIYMDQRDWDLALYHIERALEHTNLNTGNITVALFDKAEILLELGRVDEGRAVAKRLNDIAHARNDANNILFASELLAKYEAAAGNVQEAECMLRDPEIAKSYAALGNLVGPALSELAQPYLKQHRYADALRVSLEFARNVTGVQWSKELTTSLIDATEAYRALGNRERAIATIREALVLREEAHELIAGGEEQQELSAEWTASIYELAAELELDRGNVREALVLVERGRGRVLGDVIEKGHPSGSQVAEADRQTRARYEAELAKLNLELARSGGEQAKRIAYRIGEARHEYESFVDGLRARTDRRAAGGRRVDAATLDDVFHRFPRGVVVIEYVVLDEHVHSLVVRVRADGEHVLTHHTVAIQRAKLDRRVNDLVAMFSRRDLNFRGQAKELYKLLVAPAERELAGAAAILVVPDEILWRLPFAALVDSRDRYLIERAAVVYAPSISVYAAMAERSGPPVARTRPSLLAVANPSVDGLRQATVTSFYRDVHLGDLPQAEHEVDALRRIYNSPQSVVLKRNEATENRTKSLMKGASVVHFATHGVLDDLNPMYSRLVLARGGAEDGWLEAWEIANLDIDADLVVLSACDTARGRIGGGEGVVGMAWSFFLAGARSTLATQWKVESESSADLMIAFHESLREQGRDLPLRKALALRSAQLQLLRDDRYGHPFYWAAFVILGDAS